MTEYRIIKDPQMGGIKYVIERKWKFLFFHWWDEDLSKYYYGIKMSFDTLEEAEQWMEKINKP